MPNSNQSTLRIPKSIWALGFVSLLMDVSSEMIHALLPVYMVSVLGASALTIGIFEGIAEATAAITKVFSGALSDWLGKRKRLALLGYGLAALVKPVFPMASSVSWLFAARFVDRIGKGIRGAPRDALIADLSPPEIRGASYGLRQSLDTVGAFLGPLLAIGFMWWLNDNFQAVFWLAVIPAYLSVLVLIVAVKEPRLKTAKPARLPLHRSELRRLSQPFWWVVAIATLFTLARFSEAFLVLRAQDIGLPLMWIPMVMVIMSLAFSLSSYPVGILSDRVDRQSILMVGLVLLIVADLFLATAQSLIGLVIGVVLWGLHMGFTQGLLATLVADTAPADLRGTAFGMFNLITGLTLLCASVIAGALWERVGPELTFFTGAGFAALALGSLLLRRMWLRNAS